MTREDIIKLAREAGGSDSDPSNLLTVEILERFTELISYEKDREIKRLRADAERYRWLRKESGKNPDFYSGDVRWMVSRAQGGMGQNFFGDKIDFAIDTEMQRAEADRLRDVITKLVGAIDMIREALNGSNVEDLLVIVNSALSAALEEAK